MADGSDDGGVIPVSSIPATPWEEPRSPRAILAVRTQCLGDLAITLPYLRQVRERHPDARLDLLTRVEYEAFARSSRVFDRIRAIRGGNRGRDRLPSVLGHLPGLLRGRYDVVLDLQNDRMSRLVRAALRPRAWAAFDVYSPRPAAERVRQTIAQAGLGEIVHRPGIGDPDPGRGEEALRAAGWRGERLVLLNPAAFCPSRQWPDAHWTGLGRAWLAEEPVRFALVGLPRMGDRAARIARGIGPDVLDLVGATGPGDLFGVLRNVAAVVSEDSGLMHVAWTFGVPTVALFGGGPALWPQPIGAHTASLDGTGLDCAPCMAEECRLGDTRCLARHEPGVVLRLARASAAPPTRARGPRTRS